MHSSGDKSGQCPLTVMRRVQLHPIHFQALTRSDHLFTSLATSMVFSQVVGVESAVRLVPRVVRGDDLPVFCQTLEAELVLALRTCNDKIPS